MFNLTASTIIFLAMTDQLVVGPSTSTKPIFSVPFERDRQFVGRETILSRIERQVQNRYRVALYGLGGIG
jgi:hypothetical protein